MEGDVQYDAVTAQGALFWRPGGVSRLEQIEEKRSPTRHDLDPVSPENPVIVIFSDDHVYVTNSLGLSKAGINRRSVQPHARGLFGEFITDSRGEPTGVLTGRAAARILRVALNVWSTEELEANMAKAIVNDVIPYGITSLSDPQN